MGDVVVPDCTSFPASPPHCPRPPWGPGFARLWAASAATNLGDGALLAAGPLLVASVSPQPLAVGGALAAQQLPWLLFALASGAVVDSVDRRRLLAVVNATRAAVLVLLAGSVALSLVSLPDVYLALFLLGTGETLADTAAGALLVRVVHRDHLGRANARLFATFTVGNQLLGPPLGALLFVASPAAPFGLHAASFTVAAVLLARRHLSRAQHTPETVAGEGRGLREQIAEGLRWLWRHRGLPELTVCIAVMNVTFMAAFATWVLYARERLGLDTTQYGLLLTAGAVGGLAGSGTYGVLERRVGRVVLVRAGLLVEAATHLVLALTPRPAVVYLTMAVFGVHAVVWGTVATTVRQRTVPDALQGRVGNVYLCASLGGASLGALLGGGIAQALGLTAPFWIAAGGVAVLAVLIWRPLAHVEETPSTGGP